MYKVVIVDDDPIIVTELSETILWEKYDCEVVGTAENGLGGVDLIHRFHPCLIFTDIHMPQMDGLSMAAAIKSDYEDVELTVLTGDRDFELAQQAIRIGVTCFLLKPCSVEEIEEAVAAMVSRLKKKGITGQGRTSGDNANPFLVKNALEYMRANYQHKVTLTDVAESVYVSKWYMSKLLNCHTGQSFSELMNSIRIDEAKKLLADNSLLVCDIAEMTGFQDVSHFSRVFRKITGVSASEWRKHL